VNRLYAKVLENFIKRFDTRVLDELNAQPGISQSFGIVPVSPVHDKYGLASGTRFGEE